MILAPLRGVTIRCFRETFADVLREAGFTETITPFIPAIAGLNPLRDRELMQGGGDEKVKHDLRLTPQFIGKDPVALRACLEQVKAAGYETADLNCGCPFPMVRKKGRGSGILRTPDTLRRMLEVGCEVLGEGKFSIKARLGVDRADELLSLMPLINAFPLRFLTVHARTARQMYSGVCDTAMLQQIQAVSKVPIVLNGDIPFPPPVHHSSGSFDLMIGRSFIQYLGTREDCGDLVRRYSENSRRELCGERPVLGRMKELIAYWKHLPQWKHRWPILKLARTLDELCL